MVVAVLITSCQVSLKPNSGPVIIQTAIVPTASEKTIGFPHRRAVALANREYQAVLFTEFFLQRVGARLHPCGERFQMTGEVIVEDLAVGLGVCGDHRFDQRAKLGMSER